MSAIPQPFAPKILTIDIETAPIEGHVWDIWEQNVGLNQIKTEWSILAFCAKWLGKKELIYFDTGGRGKGKVRNDKVLLRKIHKLLDQADIVVAQNGKKFDIKKINARLIMEGYRPYSPIRVVDTRNEAKKHFAFTSNKLEWLTKYLAKTQKSKHKRFPGFELWDECLKDNPAAWAEMKKYNCADVISTEQVYERMLPWITGHPNLGTYQHKPNCPKCGSFRLQSRGFRVTQAGKYGQFQCMACGGWSRSKHSTLDVQSRRALLVN